MTAIAGGFNHRSSSSHFVIMAAGGRGNSKMSGVKVIYNSNSNSFTIRVKTFQGGDLFNRMPFNLPSQSEALLGKRST